MQNIFKNYSFLIVIVFVLAMFMLLKGSTAPETIPQSSEIKAVLIAGERIVVDLAIRPEEHAQGLSGRPGLAEDEGMLFVFPNPGKYYFWMKGMNFPIDIIWITEDMKVSYIQENALPEDFLETYGPDSNNKYVLEVVAGFSETRGLKAGDSVLFLY